MTRNLYWVGIIILWSSWAGATVILDSVVGYSKLATDSSGTKIYGGIAGTCTIGTDGTCNSCTGTGRTECNERSVATTSTMRLYLKTDSDKNTLASLVAKTGSNSVSIADASPSITVGSAFYVDFTWGSLCKDLYDTNNSSCTTDLDGKTLSVGFDTNNDGTMDDKIDVKIYTSYVASSEATHTECPTGGTAYEGICHFSVSKGDGKAYIEGLATGEYPEVSSSSNIQFNKILMFFEEQTTADSNDTATLARITNDSAYVELDINTDTVTVNDARLTGLTNGSKFCFALGNQDAAGNIYRFTPTISCADATCSGKCVTPEEVVGLLDNKNCFIATAAFGSEMAPEVQIFREFRDRYLLHNFIGRWFVKTYYRMSPPLAAIIKKNEFLKASARGILWPILMSIKIILHWGWGLSLMIMGVLFSMGVFYFFKRKWRSFT